MKNDNDVDGCLLMLTYMKGKPIHIPFNFVLNLIGEITRHVI